MSRAAAVVVALYTLVVGEPVTFPREEPLPHVDLTMHGPLAPTWTRHGAQVSAERVILSGLGMKTHANWVLYRLPFDPTQTERIRNVTLSPSATVPTEVAAVRIGGACLTALPYGDVSQWTGYTTSGVAETQPFGWHPSPPTDDPTIFGINVPTRVANHVACGRGDALRDPAHWLLDVTWEDR